MSVDGAVPSVLRGKRRGLEYYTVQRDGENGGVEWTFTPPDDQTRMLLSFSVGMRTVATLEATNIHGVLFNKRQGQEVYYGFLRSAAVDVSRYVWTPVDAEVFRSARILWSPRDKIQWLLPEQDTHSSPTVVFIVGITCGVVKE